MWNIFSNDINNLDNPSSAINSIFQDPVNTVANIWTSSVGTITLNIAKQQLDMAKQTFEYQKKLFYLFNQNHQIEDNHYENTTHLFVDILKSIKELNENQSKTNILLEKLLQKNNENN